MESTVGEYKSPRKRFCRQHLPHLLFCGSLVPNFPTELFCKQSPVDGVFDRYFHIPLPIVTKHELGLPFPPRNLPIKFGAKPSTIFFSYHGNRQTHKPTPVKTYSLAFAGITKHLGLHTTNNQCTNQTKTEARDESLSTICHGVTVKSTRINGKVFCCRPTTRRSAVLTR